MYIKMTVLWDVMPCSLVELPAVNCTRLHCATSQETAILICFSCFRKVVQSSCTTLVCDGVFTYRPVKLTGFEEIL
jgi:hypothetical protein